MTLKEIFAKDGPVYLTAQEGEQFAQQKLIDVDTSKTDPNNPKAYLVTLTDAGRKVVDAAPTTPPVAPPATPPAATDATPPVAPQTDPATPEGSPVDSGIGYDASPDDNIGPIVDTIQPPKPKAKKKSAGRKGPKYPFAQLPEPRKGEDGELIYSSFPVLLEEGQTIEELSKKVSSSVSAANSRSKEVVMDGDKPVIETYEGRTYLRNEDGSFKLDENGKRQSEVVQKQREKTIQTKRFRSFVMQEGDPAGKGVRVYRWSVED